MALALAAPAAVPMRALIVAPVIALVCAWPVAASALRVERACPGCAGSRVSDSMHARAVRRAQSASREGAWNEAAELWRDALLIDERHGTHWIALGDVLSRAERYREAVAAYQRAIQVDARLTRDATRSVARAYARMGNDRQVVRWLEQVLRQGASPEALWSEEVFERYRNEPRLRVVLKHEVEQRGPRPRGPGSRSA
jgi:tetratricopeptide (TPR) repeat protein